MIVAIVLHRMTSTQVKMTVVYVTVATLTKIVQVTVLVIHGKVIVVV